MFSTPGRATAVILSVWLLAGDTVVAQTIEVPAVDLLAGRTLDVTRLPQPLISMAEAVELTIRQSPELHRASERLLAATGRSQQASGLFDMTLRSAPSLTVAVQPMAPFLRKREIIKREIIQNVAEEFTKLTVGLRRAIAETGTDPPPCPSNFPDFGLNFDSVELDRLDPTDIALLGISENLGATTVINLDGVPLDFGLGDICQTPVDPFFSPDAFGGVLRKIDQSGGLGVGGVLTSVGQIPREFRMLQEQIARTVAFRANLALDKLGPVPEDDIKTNFIGDISLSRVFRTGLAAEVGFQVQSQEHNFVDKPLDPRYGALGQPQQFFSAVSGSLTVPLARGRGRVSTAAPERAADHVVIAERDQLRHSVTEQVFRTVLAYVNLAAAQETTRLLEESEARHQRILELTQQRVNSGDLAEMEVGRVMARAASVAASSAEARRAVQEARISLAESMGISVSSLREAPLPSETLATDVAGMAGDIARLERHDARAARQRREAADILAKGAFADQRPELDLTITGGFSNLYDSPFFRYFPDAIRNNIIDQTNAVPAPLLTGSPSGPLPSPVRYYDPRGFYRAITGRYEPFVEVNLTWHLPFGNNSARGRAAQAAATHRTSSIRVTDLDRVIDENIVAAAGAVRRAANATVAFQEAVENDGRLLSGVLEQLQTGDITLIDALVTEESVTGDLLQLLQQRKVYLSVLARLKFEAASLVTIEDADTPTERFRFSSSDFVGS